MSFRWFRDIDFTDSSLWFQRERICLWSHQFASGKKSYLVPKLCKCTKQLTPSAGVGIWKYWFWIDRFQKNIYKINNDLVVLYPLHQSPPTIPDQTGTWKCWYLNEYMMSKAKVKRATKSATCLQDCRQTSCKGISRVLPPTNQTSSSLDCSSVVGRHHAALPLSYRRLE